MDELIRSSRALHNQLNSEQEKLKQAFNSEADLEKKDALDTQISQIGKDIIDLENKILALEIAAKKSSFDPSRYASMSKSMLDHAEETSRVIKEHSDSVEQARCLASRVASGAKVVADMTKMLV